MKRRPSGSAWFEPSLRRRLAVIISATVASVVLLVAGAAYLVVADQLRSNQDVSLLREATRIQRLVQAEQDYVASGSENCSFAAEPACSRIITAAEPVEETAGVLRLTQAAHEVAAGGSGTTFYTVDEPDRSDTPDAPDGQAGSVRVVVVPAGTGRAVIVGTPTLLTDRAIERVGTAILITGGAGILFAGLVGYVTATIGLRPVRALASVMERVSLTRDPDERVEIERVDELGRLADSFSRMLRELSLARGAQEQLVADASHELRTPLTTLRTNLSLLKRQAGISPERRRELADAIDRELEDMQDLVTDLLDLARGEEPQPAAEPTEVLPVVEEAVAAAIRHWPDTTFSLSTPDTDLPKVHLERSRLQRLAGVLLDNAGKYGSSNGQPAIEVSIEALRNGIRINVADRGPGIPPEDLKRVFDRFYRSPSARRMPGSGLGLAIANQITASVGGRIEARSRPGGGTIIAVDLPAA